MASHELASREPEARQGINGNNRGTQITSQLGTYPINRSTFRLAGPSCALWRVSAMSHRECTLLVVCALIRTIEHKSFSTLVEKERWISFKYALTPCAQLLSQRCCVFTQALHAHYHVSFA